MQLGRLWKRPVGRVLYSGMVCQHEEYVRARLSIASAYHVSNILGIVLEAFLLI